MPHLSRTEAHRIQLALRDAGVTTTQLAELVQLPRTAVNNYRNGAAVGQDKFNVIAKAIEDLGILKPTPAPALADTKKRSEPKLRSMGDAIEAILDILATTHPEDRDNIVVAVTAVVENGALPE